MLCQASPPLFFRGDMGTYCDYTKQAVFQARLWGGSGIDWVRDMLLECGPAHHSALDSIFLQNL